MTLFFSVTLAISVVGLVLLLALKRYEMRTGRVLFSTLRPRVRRTLHATVLFVEYILPFLARRSLAKVWSIARSTLLYAIARSTVFVEELLQYILHTIEHTMQPHHTSGRPASAFLEEVAEHKRKLLRKPVERRAIFQKYQ